MLRSAAQCAEGGSNRGLGPLRQPPQLDGAHPKLLCPRQARVAKGGAVAGDAVCEVCIQPQRVAAHSAGRGEEGVVGLSVGTAAAAAACW